MRNFQTNRMWNTWSKPFFMACHCFMDTSLNWFPDMYRNGYFDISSDSKLIRFLDGNLITCIHNWPVPDWFKCGIGSVVRISIFHKIRTWFVCMPNNNCNAYVHILNDLNDRYKSYWLFPYWTWSGTDVMAITISFSVVLARRRE